MRVMSTAPVRIRRLLAAVLALVVGLTGCTSEGPESPRPPSVSRGPIDYPKLGRNIETAIGSHVLGEPTIRAVLVSVDGHTRVAHYRHGWQPDQAIHINTATPSVLSALIGIALDERVLTSLDQTLPELLPRYAADLDAEERTITLRQLLTMTAGFPHDYGRDRAFIIFNSGSGPDPTRTILRNGIQSGGGTFYSSSTAHLTSAVLREALRRADGDRPRSVLDYADEKLFGPLGIDTHPAYEAPVQPPDLAFEQRTEFGWGTDVTGLNSGCCLMRLRPADLVKIGELYRAGGRWNRRQILSAAWVDKTMTITAGSADYGYLWYVQQWGGHTVWATRSVDGQMIAVVPDRALVVVVGSVPTAQAAIPDDDVSWLLTETILPAVG